MSADETWSDSDAVVLGQNETEAEIREWLQATPYSAQKGEYKKHRLSHLEGTGDWLFNSEPFTTWHQSEDQGLLWIKGIPGSGKSVIAATLIKRLSKENAPILQYTPPLQAKIEAEYLEPKRELSSVSTATLWKDLKLALSSLPKAYCVVDALDEMDEDNDVFFEALAELAQWRPSNVKIVMTSRPASRLERPLRQMSMIHIRLEETFVDIDIAAYVAHRLQSSAAHISESDQEIIRQAVPGKANGLFLYAKLAMDSFLKEGADVKQVLTMLLTDLSIMYTPNSSGNTI